LRSPSVLMIAALAGGLTLLCGPAHASAPLLPRQASGTVTDIVDYRCTPKSGGAEQNVKVKIELTMPTGAVTGRQMTIGWRGTYAGGTTLQVPAGTTDELKLYAYASISGLAKLTSATGVGELPTIGASPTITLPATVVELRTTANNPGTATVRPAAINFGPRANDPLIQCEVRNPDALTTYSLS
jgi:hypothetical protein